MKKRILIPVDTSDHSIKSVQYVTKVFSPNKTEVVLYHVYSQLEDFFSSLDISPDPAKYEINDLMKSHQQLIDNFMHKARSILLEAGYSQSDITVKMKLQSLPGIAMEILNESKNSYHAIVIGRTGISQLNEYMGNTAASLASKVHNIPLVVVDAVPTMNNMLIAYDGSESANRSVQCVSELLEDTTYNVLLYHVIKSFKYSLIGIIQILPSQKFEKQYYEKMRKEMQNKLDNVSDQLITKGIGKGQISRSIDVGLKSRAQAIIDKSKKDDFSTIVVGRRGHRLMDIDIGTVGRKIVNLAVDRTVWIVN
jgi:nucleotide-binding universal stress UspA family protein